MPEDLSTLWSDVVTIPDFPAPGVSFKDLSGILANPIALGIVVRAWADAVGPEHPTMVVGIEARGFPLGGRPCLWTWLWLRVAAQGRQVAARCTSP